MAVAEEPGMLNNLSAGADAPASGEPKAERPTAQDRIAQVRERILQEPRNRTIALVAGVALIVAIMIGFWMWLQRPDYAVLYSGFTEKDGGSITATLEQMEVPFKVSNGGTAILVPSDRVHNLRLKLASQGLPKASGVGFEVMENQRIGSSQFLEQVNFQRALEGELGRTIQSMDSIQHARVHLAMHKASVFVRDQQKPTASVLLTLYPGRMLDRSQVNAMVHMVASSVPGLQAADVTVVDQNGELLSMQDRDKSDNDKLDAKQMRYVQELQGNIVKRVESILAPVVGAKNVRAEATVEVDFSVSEQAEEIYKQNQAPNAPSYRSQQSSESQKMAADATGGIPGAVTNQPPVPPTAPLVQMNPGEQPTAPPGDRVFTPVGQGQAAPIEGKKDSIINYEVDKTVRYSQQAMGGIKRMTVAVVVNYKPGTDADGNETLVPLTDAEKEEIASLVREAMGYNQQRGDSLSVLNSRFVEFEGDNEPPIWKRPETWVLAKDIGKYVLIAAIFLYLYMAFLKPMINKLTGKEEAERKKKEAEEAAKAAAQASAAGLAAGMPGLGGQGDVDAVVSISAKSPLDAVDKPDPAPPYQDLLDGARKIANENPKAVSNVLLEWLE